MYMDMLYWLLYFNIPYVYMTFLTVVTVLCAACSQSKRQRCRPGTTSSSSPSQGPEVSFPVSSTLPGVCICMLDMSL